jgi:hypothetical protein
MLFEVPQSFGELVDALGVKVHALSAYGSACAVKYG